MPDESLVLAREVAALIRGAGEWEAPWGGVRRRRWRGIEAAESLIAGTGAVMSVTRSGRAYYSRGLDTVVLPPRSRFASAGAYYGTAFHELAHWTRHPDRMNRDVCSIGLYAREELRAELASWAILGRLGIGFDRGMSAAYLAVWLRFACPGWGARREADGAWPRPVGPCRALLAEACGDALEIRDYLFGLAVAKAA
jgi:antirestriction protein ArdC